MELDSGKAIALTSSTKVGMSFDLIRAFKDISPTNNKKYKLTNCLRKGECLKREFLFAN
jgi:hypothetical protein